MTASHAAFAAILCEDFAPLLRDDDVSAVRLAPDGAVTITRRGKDEAIAALATAVVDAAAEAAREGPVRALLYLSRDDRSHSLEGETLFAAARVDVVSARVGAHVFIEKRARAQLHLDALEDGGLLADGVGQHLLAQLSAGQSVVVVGPASAGAVSLATALGDSLARHAPVFVVPGHAVDADRTVLDEVPSTGTPSPRADALSPVVLAQDAASRLMPAPVTGDVVTMAQSAIAVGARYLLAIDLEAREWAALSSAELPVVLIAHVRAPQLPTTAQTVFRGLTCVVGFGPRGEPRLPAIEGGDAALSHDEGRAPARPTLFADSHRHSVSERSPASAFPRATPSLRDEMALPVDRSRKHADEAGAANELPPLRPLGPAPPSTWLTDAPELDPGWDVKSDSELLVSSLIAPAHDGDGHSVATLARDPQPPAAGPQIVDPPSEGESAASSDVAMSPFAATMRDVANRPTFTPRKPREHPQARQLRADPFGGLTFEPPPDPEHPDSAPTDAHIDDADEEVLP